MCSGYRDSDIGVSVSASLAHSDYKWIMGCASLGVITQLGSACYYWRQEIDEEVSSAEGNGSCCSMLNPRNWCSKGSLLKGSMYSWSIGMVSAWFTAFWPMGGDTNALHYPTAIGFFLASTVAMLLYSIYEWKKHKGKPSLRDPEDPANVSANSADTPNKSSSSKFSWKGWVGLQIASLVSIFGWQTSVSSRRHVGHHSCKTKAAGATDSSTEERKGRRGEGKRGRDRRRSPSPGSRVEIGVRSDSEI